MNNKSMSTYSYDPSILMVSINPKVIWEEATLNIETQPNDK